MGWLDKAKGWLGLEPEEEEDEPIARPRPRKGERPPLDPGGAPPQQSLDDALAAREAGELDEMRRLLREMDRGQGLRLTLRAAAALEAGDEQELAELLPRVRGEQPAWRLPLQLAAVLKDQQRADRFRRLAAELSAPRWAMGWSRALSSDAAEQRRGLVELLISDPALARTVAARDLKLEGAESDADAAPRYAAFAHGRACIERFGPELVADLLERAGNER